MSKEKSMERDSEIVNEICGALSEVSIKDSETLKKTENAAKGVDIAPKDLSREEEVWWKKLKLLHCPFSWNDLREIESDDKTSDRSRTRMSQIEEKIEEIEEPETFQYRKLILNIVLVYEQFVNGTSGSCLAVLRETEALLASSSSGTGALRKLFTDIEAALQHVVSSCRVFVQFYSHVLSEVERTYAKITQLDDMSDVCKAGIFGIRAATLMEYGYKGNLAALKHIETALSLDPNQGEWHFLQGKCLGRLRRIDTSFQIPEKKELKSLEEAVRLTTHPPYIVFLAQAYRETAFRAFSEMRQNATAATAKGPIDKMNERALRLYKEALELRPECSHMNVRCALGFMKLPNPYKDLARAKKCLDNALKHAPNNAMVNHTTAMFYERFEKNMAEAKKYYKQAGELGAFGSYMDLLRLRYYENKFDYNPIPDLETGFRRFQDAPYQQECTLQMGSYYLFIKDDIENAFKYWERVIDEDPDAEKLKKHKCLFLRMLVPVNVYEVLCDESRLVLQFKPHKAKGKESLYRRIIMKCHKNYPACATTSPIPRRKMVLAEVDEVERSYRSKLRGRGRGRGRGYRGGERGGREHSTEGWRGNRGGQRGRGYRGGGPNRGNRSRDSSTDSHIKDHSSDRKGSAVDRNYHGNNYDGRYSRDSSAESYHRHHSNERRGYRGGRGNNQARNTDYESGCYSRDSSTDSHRRHYSSERQGFAGSRGGDRSSNAGTYRRRDYSEQGDHRRDSSAESRSSCGSTDSMGRRGGGWRGGSRGGRSVHGGRWRGNSRDHRVEESNWRTGPRERNNSDSSTEGSVARKLSAGRVRTDSTSSVNSCPDETKVDWRQGCRMSPSSSINEDFANSRNTHFKQQHNHLKKSQAGHKMWWCEQD